jgi:hypothetical protein
LTLEPHFVRPSGHISWLLVGTACGLKRDKKKKERETVTEGKRQRERELREIERRCEDVCM